jgi:transposase
MKPREWKVIETVREKFTCRDCEKISQTPATFHCIPRAWAGPSLSAMIVFEKFGQHQPLNRQAAAPTAAASAPRPCTASSSPPR